MIPARPKAATPVWDAALLEVEAGELLPVLEVVEDFVLVLVLIVVPDDAGALLKSHIT